MKAMKTAAILTVLLMAASALWGATRYGDAVIERGGMTVLRDGKLLKFKTADEIIPINEQDLIRVRPASRVVLTSREKASVTLGGNAVFHVKPWRAKNKGGFLRALFGRFRATIVGLTGGEEFNVRTATATIGVKGTEYRGQVTNRGSTAVAVTENVVGVRGQSGPENNVGQGFLSAVLGTNPATPPAPVPPEVEEQWGDDDLDAPPANSPEGGDLAGEEGLIKAGILSEEDVDDNKGDDGTDGDLGDGSDDVPTLNFDPNEAADSVQRGRVRIGF